MRSCNQATDFSVCLFGRTLPKYILYGKVNNKIYTCNIFTPAVKTRAGKYTRLITIYDEKRREWFTRDTLRHGDIFLAIENYVKTHDILGDALEFCEHKAETRKRQFYAEKRKQAEKARREEKARVEVLRICGAPQERRSVISACGAARHTFMNEGGRVETDKVWIDDKNPNPIPADYRDRGYWQEFEMGQTTCGVDDDKYTRSGFEVKRNSLITERKDLLGEGQDSREYMKHVTSKNWKGDNFKCETRGSASTRNGNPLKVIIAEERAEAFRRKEKNNA